LAKRRGDFSLEDPCTFAVWADRLADVADGVPVAVVPVVEEQRVAAAAFESAHAAA
jgi:hypothetical protein